MSRILELLAPVALLVLVAPRLVRSACRALGRLSAPLRARAPSVARWATHLLRLGSLPVHHLPAVYGGALLITAATALLIVCGWNLIAPALAPILDVPTEALQLDVLGNATVGALLVVPAIAGTYLSDLAGWSRVSPVGREGKGRTRAVLYAVPTFLWGFVTMLVLGAYRAGLQLEPQIGFETAEYYAGYFGAWILLSADALVVLGIFLGLPSFEDVVRLVLAIAAYASALAMTVTAVLIDAVLAVAEPLCDGAERLWALVQRGLGRAAGAAGRVGASALELPSARASVGVAEPAPAVRVADARPPEGSAPSANGDSASRAVPDEAPTGHGSASLQPAHRPRTRVSRLQVPVTRRFPMM